MAELRHIVEAILFVSDAPVTVEHIHNAVPEAELGQIRAALVELNQEYEARGGGFCLHHVAGGYQLRTRPSMAGWIRRLHRSQPQRLSRAALETLAIIAYKQPVMRAEIEHIRGVDSGGVLRQLLEKELIRVLGRKDIPGRPMIYATTKHFLEVFDLKDLSELPTLKEIEELGFERPDGAPAEGGKPGTGDGAGDGPGGGGEEADGWDEEGGEGAEGGAGAGGPEPEDAREEPDPESAETGEESESGLDSAGYARGAREGVDIGPESGGRLSTAWPGRGEPEEDGEE